MMAAEHMPINRYGILLVFRAVTDNGLVSYVEQIFHSDSGMSFMRLYTSTWSNWQEITLGMPSFYKNYSDLSSLATALGVLGSMGELRNGDLNALNVGVYNVRPPEGTILNCPTQTYGTLIQFPDGDYNSHAYAIQLLMDNDNKIWIRHKVSNWGNWISII